MQVLITVKTILKAKEAGVSLIETLVALALLALIAVGFLSGMSTTFKASMVSHDRVAAESLANSQLEYIKVQEYIAQADYNPDNPASRYALIDIPADLAAQGYTIEISPPQTVYVPGGSGSLHLQSITVIIRRNGENKLTISDHKIGGLT